MNIKDNTPIDNYDAPGISVRRANSLDDLGDRISVMGVELRKTASVVVTSAVPESLRLSLTASELRLLQNVAIAIELGQPLLLRDSVISQHLPLLRLLSNSVGRELVYIDGQNGLTYKAMRRAAQGDALLAIDSIELLWTSKLPEASILKSVLALDNSSAYSSQQRHPDFRLIASTHFPPDAATSEIRELLSHFVYAYDHTAAAPIQGSPPQNTFAASLKQWMQTQLLQQQDFSSLDAAKGAEIERLPEWSQVDNKLRAAIHAAAEMVARGMLMPSDQTKISVATHYPRIIGYMWRFCTEDLGASARQAYRHVLFGYFTSADDRARLNNILRTVTADAHNTKFNRQSLTFPTGEPL